jgi:hypothetical protein
MTITGPDGADQRNRDHHRQPHARCALGPPLAAAVLELHPLRELPPDVRNPLPLRPAVIAFAST